MGTSRRCARLLASGAVSVVHLPNELAARLATEAARRGVTVDELVFEALTIRFPDAGRDTGGDALEAFIGSGDSGDPAWATGDSVELRRHAANRRAG